jgi:adenylosuccinate lyase
MDRDERFTDGRVPDSTIRSLFTDEHRWQRWLEVEGALATAEAEVGIIPHDAAKAINDWADIKRLDVDRIRSGRRKTSHKLMSLITELSNAVGDPHGGWVHWGATSENIHKTGDMLVLRDVHHVFLQLLGKIFAAMESLAIQGQDMICAGRTHGQQAVPITFGFKVASWIDEFERHIERLHAVEPRVFTAMMGGAVGNFASLGEKGPLVQEKMAKLLDLESMTVPSRAMSDALAEYICILGLLAGTSSKIAREITLLMEPEFDEVYESLPQGTISSSTMPHKRNPQLADDCIAFAAEIRALVPLALQGMLHDHEVNGANTTMTDDALKRACILTGDLLTRLLVILSGLTLNKERMRDNLDLTGGLIMSEAIMLALGESIGRQHAHEIIYEDAQKAVNGKKTFKEFLCEDSRVTKYLDAANITRLLDPATHIGLSAKMASDAAKRAHIFAEKLQRAYHN